jgi:predicted O-methyltransferase YrrM
MTHLAVLKKNWGADLYLAWLFFTDLVRLYFLNSNNEIDRYNLLFSVAVAANPKVILELGTGPGLSSLAFIRTLQYYRKSGRNQGVFHTCDIEPRTIQMLKRFVRFGSLVVPHPISTDALAVEWAKHATPIDLLYIDAYHSDEQSQADFDHFAPFVAPNGLVLMHDTFPLSEMHEQLQYSGTVWKTAQYIKKQYAGEFEFMTVPYLCGVSLLRKKGAKYF